MSAGFLAFASGAEPYSLVSSTPTVGTTLSVDRECLSVPRNSVDQLTVVYRPQLARFLHGVAQGLVSLEQHDSVGLTHHLAGLGDHVVRTVVNVAPNETTTARIRVEQIHRYISEHLADPNLSAAVIAQALHVSTRQVYQAFSTQPETLGQLIRRLRVAYAQSLAKAATPAANLDRAMLARQCGFGSVRSLQRALREHHHQL